MKTFFKRRWYFFIPLILFAILVFGFIIMALWNFIMPAIFNLPQITFWQALALLLLSRILFSGGPRHCGYGGPWRGKFRSRWTKMSPEEKENFYKRWSSCYPGSSRKEETPAQ